MASHLSLRGLTIEGPGKQAASVSLRPGLNAIVGATGTGKSYIFQAIDFCLGAGKLPKRPKEAEGYKTAQLTISVDDAAQYVLSRQLDGGKITATPYIDGVPQLLGADVLLESHDEKKSLSSWLLNLIGIAGLKVIKNSNLERQAFTYRNVAQLTLVDENRVIAEHSPAIQGRDTAVTSDQRAFNVMITGLGDDSSSPVTPTKAKRNLVIDGKIEWISGEVDRLKTLLTPFIENGDNPSARIVALDHAIEAATSIVTATKARVSDLEAKRIAVRQSAIAFSDRIRAIDERVKQFLVLRQFYDTDTDRIKATLEAGHAFERLPGGHCAVCGMLPDETSHTSNSIDIYVAAARSELAKLEQLKSELDEALVALKLEREEAQIESVACGDTMEQIEREIMNTLKPQAATTAHQIKELMTIRFETARAADSQITLERLKLELLELEKLKKKSVVKPTQPEKVPSGSIKDFCQTVTETLRSWRFPLNAPVTFDEKTFDLTLDGQTRGGLGKGHRALTHAAFTISIMRYCLAAGLPHPGFVVLDSPLNPFKGKTESEDGEMRVSHEVQDAFYADLASRPLTEQYVIIENTEVPADLISRINHVSFSGNPVQPRAGFFPS